MSEKFNPLAEAESNASHDRRRFYDWTGDNADHQSNEEFRAANEDMAEYLRSRNFEDDNGSLHNAENSKFMKSPNHDTDDEYYNRMQSDAETEGPFAGKSLKEVAEMVREAKEQNDKTLELDARAAFDDKFMEVAEKYEWQGITENADGTSTDRNAIADQKLAYYESLMQVDTETDELTSNPDLASAPNSGKRRADVPVDSESPLSAEASEELAGTEGDESLEQDYTPKHRAEYSDEDSPLFDEVADSHKLNTAEVLEGESQEEYESRQDGRHRAATGADELEMIEIDKSSNNASDLDMIDDENSEGQSGDKRSLRDRLRRVRTLATPSGLGAELTTARALSRNERASNNRFNKITKGLGAAALLIGGGLLLMKGHDIFNGGDSGNGGGLGIKGNGSPRDNMPDFVPGSGGDGNGSGESIPPVGASETVRVSHGDGEIKVLQEILANNGINVDTTQAQRIGEHAGLSDILKADGSYDHSGSSMDRIQKTGTFTVRDGVVSKALKSAKDLGIK